MDFPCILTIKWYNDGVEFANSFEAQNRHPLPQDSSTTSRHLYFSNNMRLTGKNLTAELLVGQKLRELRTKSGLSLRALAERSGLNFNTLSLVENGKSSPSVGTLQQLALALKVPISSFFEAEPAQKHIVFTPADQRPQATFGNTTMQNLAKDLAGSAVQPFEVTLMPGESSGEHEVVHTGHEFVYCLGGTLEYQIDHSSFILNTGDSLVFESHLPHQWKNIGKDPARMLLIFYPTDRRDDPGGRHFPVET